MAWRPPRQHDKRAGMPPARSSTQKCAAEGALKVGSGTMYAGAASSMPRKSPAYAKRNFRFKMQRRAVQRAAQMFARYTKPPRDADAAVDA